MGRSIRTALYRLYDDTDALLYVGIAEDPRERWSQHAADKSWWPEVTRRDVEWIANRADAERTEREAIMSEKPRYNRTHAIGEMSSGEAATLFAEYKAATETERRLREPMREAARLELEAGTSVKDLAHATGLTPEVFRRIRDAHNIPVDPRYKERAERLRKTSERPASSEETSG